METANSHSPVNWENVADEFCAAWTSPVGKPDLDRLACFYAPDDDVIIYDTLAPLEGFRGFTALKASIYEGLRRIGVRRTGPVVVRPLAGGEIVVTAYLSHLSYEFTDGRRYEIDSRISEVWERRNGRYVVVHEHPSTVYQEDK